MRIRRRLYTQDDLNQINENVSRSLAERSSVSSTCGFLAIGCLIAIYYASDFPDLTIRKYLVGVLLLLAIIFAIASLNYRSSDDFIG